MTLWEIWSVGEDPFPEVPLEDLHYSLTERCLIPPQPPNCPGNYHKQTVKMTI